MNLRKKGTQTFMSILSSLTLSCITCMIAGGGSVLIHAYTYHCCFFQCMIPKAVAFLIEHKPLRKIDVIESFYSTLFLLVIFIVNTVTPTIINFSPKIQFAFGLGIFFYFS